MINYELVLINRKKRSERMRTAKLKGTHTKDDWLDMKRYFAHCVRCGKNEYNLEKDHIIPIYQGGSDKISNIQPVCARCNSSKSAEDIDHRIIFCEKYGYKMRKEWIPDGPTENV